MQKFSFIVSILLISVKSVFAFDPPPPPDTVLGSWTPYHAQLLQAPVITGVSAPINIVPNTTTFCFDKQIAVKSLLVTGEQMSQCLYLNTTDKGLVGHCKPQITATGDMCDIKPNDPEFSFFLYGLKGNTYHYYNRQDGSTIKHYVMTANSQSYAYQTQRIGENNEVILHKKTETRMYCNDKIKGKAYKFDGDERTWYIWGRDYPETLKWINYIGNFGVGYLYTDKGLYMIMELEFGGNSFRVTSAETVNVCFDPRPFQVVEDQFYLSRRADLDEQRQKLIAKQAKLSSGDCQSERTALYNWEVQQLNQQELNLENSMVGNAWQNAETQNAILGIMDPRMMLEASILQTKIDYCKATISLNRSPSSVSANDRFICLIALQVEEQAALAQMNAIDIEYADNKAKALSEKSTVYLHLMQHACR